jgi:hypothetical protein
MYCKRVKRVKNQTTKKEGWELIAIDPINSLKIVNNCLYGPSIVDIPHLDSAGSTKTLGEL